MPATATTAPAVELRHEEFCTPPEGMTAPRVEGYVHYGDDPATGRSLPSHDVIRCCECGAAKYLPRRS